MICIAITSAAFDAIAATLRLDVSDANAIKLAGGTAVANKIAALRRPGEE